MIIIIILLYFLVILFDFVPVCKGKNKLLICVYSALILISFTVLILKELNIDIPTIGKPISYIIKDILKLK